MLEALNDDQFVELFAKEMKRRQHVGLICCIMDTQSLFIGCYPKEWKDMNNMPLHEQLNLLAAYTSITEEKQRYVIDEVPKFEITRGGKK